jgi:soluble lytic murein transglycosylase-like protein
MWGWLWGMVLCLGVWTPTSWADDPKLDACIVAAAHYRHIDPALLKAIAIQESGLNLRAVNRNNANGSVDHGPFQINSGWLPKLKKHGITVAQLYDPCISAYVAAWILADSINRHGATWRAVGAYNSPTEANRKAYATLIRQHYARLLAGQR